MMSPAQMAAKVTQTLDNKLAKNIKILKTDMITVLADYFVICTATSTTQLKALSEEVDKVLSEAGEPPLRREGYRSGSWVLLDFGCVITHIFLEDAREFYGLERLWSDAREIPLSEMLDMANTEED